MKTEVKKVTIADYSEALSESISVIRDKHPKTKLAGWCQKFITLNATASKKLEKKVKRLNKPYERELEDLKLRLAEEKDGIIDYTEDGKFKFKRDNEISIINKQREINDKLDELYEELNTETIDVRVLTEPFELPDNIEPNTVSVLSGFVIKPEEDFEITE